MTDFNDEDLIGLDEQTYGECYLVPSIIYTKYKNMGYQIKKNQYPDLDLSNNIFDIIKNDNHQIFVITTPAHTWLLETKNGYFRIISHWKEITLSIYQRDNIFGKWNKIDSYIGLSFSNLFLQLYVITKDIIESKDKEHIERFLLRMLNDINIEIFGIDILTYSLGAYCYFLIPKIDNLLEILY